MSTNIGYGLARESKDKMFRNFGNDVKRCRKKLKKICLYDLETETCAKSPQHYFLTVDTELGVLCSYLIESMII